MEGSTWTPPVGWHIVDVAFYLREVQTVAKDLLGKVLVAQHPEGTVAVRLTEVEAYGGIADRACHAYGGRCTERTRPMYAQGGTLYIYLCYGMHLMLNIVTGEEGNPCAVLIRSGEPVWGIELMQRRRGTQDTRKLTVGPGRLTQALGLSLRWTGTSLFGHPYLSLWEDGSPPPAAQTGPRIGIAYAGPDALLPWRYWVRNSIFVSCLSKKNSTFA